jgi:hypothetical protein
LSNARKIEKYQRTESKRLANRTVDDDAQLEL